MYSYSYMILFKRHVCILVINVYLISTYTEKTTKSSEMRKRRTRRWKNKSESVFNLLFILLRFIAILTCASQACLFFRWPVCWYVSSVYKMTDGQPHLRNDRLPFTAIITCRLDTPYCNWDCLLIINEYIFLRLKLQSASDIPASPCSHEHDEYKKFSRTSLTFHRIWCLKSIPALKEIAN